MYKHEYIKQAREEKKLSTVEMAKLLKMDCGNYCKLEQGKYKSVPGKILPKLCFTLGIDLYCLLGIAPGEVKEGAVN